MLVWKRDSIKPVCKNVIVIKIHQDSSRLYGLYIAKLYIYIYVCKIPKLGSDNFDCLKPLMTKHESRHPFSIKGWSNVFYWYQGQPQKGHWSYRQQGISFPSSGFHPTSTEMTFEHSVQHGGYGVVKVFAKFGCHLKVLLIYGHLGQQLQNVGAIPRIFLKPKSYLQHQQSVTRLGNTQPWLMAHAKNHGWHHGKILHYQRLVTSIGHGGLPSIFQLAVDTLLIRCFYCWDLRYK